ncbi:capsular polysaccharide export protein, LipB/KpsS family [Burkholderia contaminans]|uniref:capsular polysaccharide export protein, LipB/KpsS family n=1 Tax=Burkholderia contaminans TaxID=488447 RepID=UPI000CFE9BE2|nr:capsular biosynthesis protein [Burkholderia contaminans]PRD92454.1 capsular biosynthesis protein [Burkholderia contaminans]
MMLMVVDSMERYRFLVRLANAVRGEYSFLFVTSEPLAHRLLKRAGFRSVYLRVDRDAPYDPSRSSVLTCQDAIEVLNGTISPERAHREGASIVRAVSRVIAAERLSRCVMWNGHQLVCRAVAHACAAQELPTTFVEISNLPDKLFVDPLGVNALSSIARTPSVIDRLPLPDERVHRAWLERYEAYKARPLPQATTSLTHMLSSAVNYALKVATSGVARNGVRFIAKRPVSIDATIATSLSADELARRRYVFLPLQVSDDTQLRLHSDVGNLEALEIALRYASHEQADLIVKIHPAERDVSLVDALLRLQRWHRFAISASNTVDLIRHACLVVTINSTVGLEAMLYDKRVAPLGRCFYRSFDAKRLRKYIHSFLVDGVDYFGTGAIPACAAHRILSAD